jgi:O-methyltransferase involved in polyketide biosynthesis
VTSKFILLLKRNYENTSIKRWAPGNFQRAKINGIIIMEATNKVYLTEEKETLLITLYAKALDSRSKHSILHDNTADNILKTLEYDFTKHKDFGNRVIVIRARQFDEWIKEFIKANMDAVVIYAGCGLDTRITRINPPPGISWFDVDYPEVISLRKAFYSNRNGYQMIESSVIQAGWVEKIPRNKPALIIAEGLLEYLTVAEVKTLFNRLTDHFHQGQIMFDVMNSFAINSGKEALKRTTGAIHKWAVDDACEVDALNSRLKRITELSLFKSPYIRQLPFAIRLLLGGMSLIPRFKYMVRLMRYDF